MGALLRKYATATASGTHVGIPMIKAGSQDFATGSDWTPSAGDVRVSIDGGAQANITNLPTYSNGQWIFVLTALETTGKSIRVAVVDSATKAVEDQFFVVETFGSASAMYAVDFADAAAFGLSRLDATVSSRSTYAGGAVASVTAAVTLPANPPADWLNAASVKADAVTKIQAGLSTFDPTATGVHLTAAGLDAVAVESGVNARQALSPILAASAGVLSGAGTGTVVVKGGNVATTRITATTDSSGNRSAVTLALPT